MLFINFKTSIWSFFILEKNRKHANLSYANKDNSLFYTNLSILYYLSNLSVYTYLLYEKIHFKVILHVTGENWQSFQSGQ